jgi:gliding motility-associated-like protein
MCPKPLLLSLLLFLFLPGRAQLTLTTNNSAQQMAQRLVGNGVTVSNATLTGELLGRGFFRNAGGNQLGLDSGIVLSNGRLLSSNFNFLVGMNGAQTLVASNALNEPGDADLSQMLGGVATADASVLEFDFIPLGDSIRFRYVMTSEEYPLFVCSEFNDAFAFFLEGPGIVGRTNIALVPGTSIPVAVNSINSGVPGNTYPLSVCQSMGPGSPFTQYFVNNTGNGVLTHNGHTRVMTASARVVPCQSYHLKIVIADAGLTDDGMPDGFQDSGIFLEAGSLTSSSLRIVNLSPLRDGKPGIVEGCQSGALRIVRSKKYPTSQVVNLSFSGPAVNGVDVALLPASVTIPANDSIVDLPLTALPDPLAESREPFTVYISTSCNGNLFYSDSLTVYVHDYDTLVITPPTGAGFCRDAPLQLHAPSTYDSYAWTPAAVLNNTTISNPVAILTSPTVIVCFAQIGTCRAKDSVMLVPKTLRLLLKADIRCHNGATGQIHVGSSPTWVPPLLFNIDSGPFGPDSTFTGLPAGSHTVRIRDATGCVDSLTVVLQQMYPDLIVQHIVVPAACAGGNGSVTMSGSGGLPGYQFSLDNSPFADATTYTASSGPHLVSIRDLNGCVETGTALVPSDPPIVVSWVASAASCSGQADGELTLSANGGNGTFAYSSNGVDFQASNQLSVHAGPGTLTVRDTKGCTVVEPFTIPLNNTLAVDAGVDQTICEGQAASLQALANGAAIAWTGPAIANGPTATPTVNPVTTSLYHVTASTGICMAVDSLWVYVRPAPLANAGKDSSICVGKEIRLKGSGGIAYSWTSTGAVAIPPVHDPLVRPASNTSYFLAVADVNGCSSLLKDTVVVTTVPAVKAFAGRDTSVAIGEGLILQALDAGNSGATQYLWLPDEGLDNNRVAKPLAMPVRDITYRVTLRTPEGCEGSDDVSIKVFRAPDIYVPSAFTPNGDRINDVLRAIPVGMRSFTFFRVYNRWGEQVFATTDASRGWDGMVRGKASQTATYVWFAEAVDFNGRPVIRKGVVTIIR